MNISVLSTCIGECATEYMWRHCIKIILEITQMMCAYLTEEEVQCMLRDGLTPYKPTHRKHPMTVWVNTSYDNYRWSGALALALCTRYRHAYGKTHACRAMLVWMVQHIQRPRVDGTITPCCSHHVCSAFNLTSIPQCMPDIYKDEDSVVAYQSYYVMKRNTIRDFTPPSSFN